MTAIDTYTKYNLHSALRTIHRGDVRVCKKTGGNVRGECPTLELSIPR